MPDSTASVDVDLLAGLIRSGDQRAESQLVEHFTPRVRAMALARLRNPDLARDVTQETLVAVLQATRKGQVRDHTRLAAYVQGVARNMINNGARRQRQFPEVELDEVTQDLTVTEDHTLRERRALLVQALRRLDPPDRQVLLFTLVDDLKPAEIAARIGVTAEAIRTRKTRALRRILEVVAELSRPGPSYHITKGADSRE